jgi:glycosyltransferase involved in cell wall biosynthesis
MRIALITARNPLANCAGRSSTGQDWAEQSGHAAGLARVLASHGHRVTIYCRDDGTGQPRNAIAGKGVSVEHVPTGPARVLGAEESARHMPDLAAHLARRWQVKRPDVVHAFGWTSGLAALGAVRDTDIPVVQSFGSLAAAERRQFGGAVAASRLRLETLIGRKADAVLAASSQEAADLARLSVPRPSVRVVPVAVDTAVFSPGGARSGRSNRIRLVAIAGSHRTPGLQTVVRAVAQVPEAELVIAGGPDGRHLPRTGPFRELARLATELGIRGQVAFAGELPPTRLAALLRSADVLVSVAAYEPSGLAAVQAMACGTPAVVSAVGGQADAVVDGTTGLLVEPEHPVMLGHRLRQLLATPTLVRAYGIAAADRAQSRYSWERIGRETAAVYERCLPGRIEAEAEDLDAVAVG